MPHPVPAVDWGSPACLDQEPCTQVNPFSIHTSRLSQQSPKLICPELTICCPVVQFAALVGEVGAHQVSEVLPKVVDRFAPLFVGDHMVAL